MTWDEIQQIGAELSKVLIEAKLYLLKCKLAELNRAYASGELPKAKFDEECLKLRDEELKNIKKDVRSYERSYTHLGCAGIILWTIVGILVIYIILAIFCSQ